MTDISKFILYFLNSLPSPIKDLFYIDIDSNEKKLFGESFYITIPSIADTIQKNVDIKISSCGNILAYPKYLILYVDRSENGCGFNTNKVTVNTYLSILNKKYRFKSAILFTGTYQSGHYTSLIKGSPSDFFHYLITQ